MPLFFCGGRELKGCGVVLAELAQAAGRDA